MWIIESTGNCHKLQHKLFQLSVRDNNVRAKVVYHTKKRGGRINFSLFLEDVTH